MKSITTSIIIFLTVIYLYGQPTFCLQLTPVSNTSTELIVAIEIQGDNAFNLGSSNFQFSFDNIAFSDPTLESHYLTEMFGPFTVYEIPTVTTPRANEVSFNVELVATNVGDEMSGPSNWTRIGDIKFIKTGMSVTQPFVWSYNGGTTETVVYLHNESTQIFANNTSCLVGVNTNILPVELLYFTAKEIDQSAFLYWETVYEESNRGFYVERSTDGQSFQELDFITGENSPSLYEYLDQKPSQGKNYYRLRQVDLDGLATYSEIRIVSFNQQGIRPSVFPNPTNGPLEIVYKNQIISPIMISVFNTNGEIVYHEWHNDLLLDLNHLSAGVYTLECMGQRVRFVLIQ
ncbi:MAG: T9SS type A sorting domain-containing protein [Bacteroidota bacterium]